MTNKDLFAYSNYLTVLSYKRMLEYIYASVLNSYLYKLHTILTNLIVSGQIKEVVFQVILLESQVSIKG